MGRKKIFCELCNDGETLKRSCYAHNPKLKESTYKWRDGHREQYLEKKKEYNAAVYADPERREEIKEKAKQRNREKRFEAKLQPIEVA